MTRTALLGVVLLLTLLAGGTDVFDSSGAHSSDSAGPTESRPTERVTPPVTPVVAAVCAPSSTPCEDVYVSDPETGECTTNLGRPCIEAIADAALHRRMSDPTREPLRAGDIEVLEVVDDLTLVVGFAAGDVSLLETEVLEEPAQVTITVVVADRALGPPEDGNDATVALAVLKTGRVIVTLEEPLVGRELSLDLLVVPPP